MIIRTRKLPATSSEGERMRATSDSGVQLTIPFNHSAEDPNRDVAERLAAAIGWTGAPITRTSGNTFLL